MIDSKFYEYKYGVSIDSPLGPVLANIKVTKLEAKLIRKLVEYSTIKFYGYFFDDTLAVIKPKDIGCVHQTLTNFDKNLYFIIDTFENVASCFVDLERRNDGIALFKKPSDTGQYFNDKRSNVL